MPIPNIAEIPDIYQLVSEYHFVLGELETRITIRIHKLLGRELFVFTQSHFIHTPTQIDAYITNINTGDTEEWALTRALWTFSYYGDAIRAGHKPEESWLVANPYLW